MIWNYIFRTTIKILGNSGRFFSVSENGEPIATNLDENEMNMRILKSILCSKFCILPRDRNGDLVIKKILQNTT